MTYNPLTITPVYDAYNVQTNCSYTGDVTIVYEYDGTESEGSNSNELKEDDIHLDEHLDGCRSPYIGNVEVTCEKTITVIQFIDWLRTYASDRVESVNLYNSIGFRNHLQGVYEWVNGKLQSVRTFGDVEIDALNNRIVSMISGRIISNPITLNPNKGRLTFEVSVKMNKEEM